MKRILYLFAFVLICSMAQAVDTTVQIKIRGASKPSVSTDAVYLIQADRYSAAKDTSDIAKLMNPDTQVSVWAISPVLGNLSTMQTNDLKGIYIGFHANANTNYTMTFDPNWLQGGTLYLKDWVRDTVFAMTASMSYPFSVATKSTTYTTRFQIVGSFTPDPGNLEVCHIGNNLEVKNNPFIQNIVVKNEDGDKVMDVEPENTPQVISLADLPKGRYTVEFNDGKEVFVISVKPTMTLTPDTSFAASINKGEQFLFACTPRTEAGTYTETFKSASGADSIVHLYLSYIPCDTAYGKAQFTLCQKELPYTYKDVMDRQYVISNDTTFIATFPDMAASGCDSVATLTFIVNRVKLDSREKKTVCNGEYFVWRGQVCDQEKVYYDTVRYKVSGCDSAYYQMDVKFSKSALYETSRQLCESQLPYVYQGSYLKAPKYIVKSDTIISDTIVAGTASGCDSIVRVTFTVNRVMPDSMEKRTLCFGEKLEWHGMICDQAKTYTFTEKYAESGCDSVHYSLELSFYPEYKSSRSMRLCPSELPYLYQGEHMGAKSYLIKGDTTVLDTVFAGSSTGCDSIVTIRFKVLTEPKQERSFTLCESELPFTYQGKHPQSKKFIITDDVEFNDTVPSAQGCDSVTTLRFKVNRVVVRDNRNDTICEGEQVLWRNHFYTQAKTYVETEKYRGTDCDSAVFTLTITYWQSATLPRLINYVYLMDNPVCGRAINTLDMMNKIDEDIAKQAKEEAKISERWLEINLGTAWVKLPATFQPMGQQSFSMRLVGKTICGDQLTGDPYTFTVLAPAPETTPEYDNLPAVSKYNDWLLMLNLNQISADLDGFVPEQQNVSWFRVNGDLDNTQTGVKDDGQVGTGYYYTDNRALEGKYYAIIHAGPSLCNAVMRTQVIECKAKAQLTLAPRRLRSGEVMTLSNINPEQSTQLTVYTTDGKMLRQRTLMGVENLTIQAQDNEGIYLLRVENGDRVETFKYILTK